MAVWTLQNSDRRQKNFDSQNENASTGQTLLIIFLMDVLKPGMGAKSIFGSAQKQQR